MLVRFKLDASKPYQPPTPRAARKYPPINWFRRYTRLSGKPSEKTIKNFAGEECGGQNVHPYIGLVEATHSSRIAAMVVSMVEMDIASTVPNLANVPT